MFRRNFLKTAALATAGAATLPALTHAAAASPGNLEISLFTKHFLGLEFEKLADTLASLEVKSIEAPVRKGGHVEPERVEEDLPKLVEVLKSRGIRIELITSNINAVKPEQHTEKVLRTAARLGIPGYRMQWFRYDLGKSVLSQLEAWKPQLRELVAFSKEAGIRPLYQNHSGKEYCGAPIWDVYQLLKDFDPKEIAFAFDIMHATVEGASAWPIQVNLIQDRIGVAYFKDFRWEKNKRVVCPLGEGMVDKAYVKLLKKQSWSGPVALHVEYLEGQPKNDEYLDKAVKATRQDLASLKAWWQAE